MVSTESLATPAAPHQFDPKPPGLIELALESSGPFVVAQSLVKALQAAFDMSVSE